MFYRQITTLEDAQFTKKITGIIREHKMCQFNDARKKLFI